MLKVSSLRDDDGAPADPEAGMNRKEREALEAARKKEEYMKKHLAGETEQARKDLERLALVRKRREEAAGKLVIHTYNYPQGLLALCRVRLSKV